MESYRLFIYTVCNKSSQERSDFKTKRPYTILFSTIYLTKNV